MNKRTIAFLCCLALALPLAAQTQQVTKVGIIDFNKVLLTSYKDSKAYRDFDQARTDYNKEITARSKELLELQSQRLDADKAGNKNQVLSLDKSIADKQAYLDSYKQVKGAMLQQQSSSLLSGSVIQEILDAVKFVSESGGFALVVRKDSASGKDMILYSLPEIDITQDVIAELMKRQGKLGG
jgi:outer membrane protein